MCEKEHFSSFSVFLTHFMFFLNQNYLLYDIVTVLWMKFAHCVFQGRK